jgi:hypothetical protein
LLPDRYNTHDVPVPGVSSQIMYMVRPGTKPSPINQLAGDHVINGGDRQPLILLPPK